MCCVSLPGPLQPLSLSSSASPSPSSSSSSSSSADLPPACLPSKSSSHLQTSSHVAELPPLPRRKLGLLKYQAPVQKRQQQQKKDTSSLEGHKNLLDLAAHSNKRRSSKADDVRKSWELLKSGEVSSLIKQGFMERTQRRLSPGRVSPLVQDNLTVSTKKVVKSHDTPCRKLPSGPQPAMQAASSMKSPLLEKPTKTNTLLDMMSKDADTKAKPEATAATCIPSLQRLHSSGSVIIDASSSRNPIFNNVDASDVKLTLKGIDGGEVCLNLHCHVLVKHSKYFAARLTDTWCKQPQQEWSHLLLIEDCEDLEVYQETLHLLYCQDLQSRLMRCNVPRVLAILKVASLILFDACIASCLEYLEATPWAEEEEEKVRTLLGQLQIGSVTATNVLKRLTNDENNGLEGTLACLIQTVIKGKDNKARREMKALVSKMLRENVSQNSDCVDVSKESLYQACTACLDTLSVLFLQASRINFMSMNQANEDRSTLMAQIAHQSDNLMWLLEILLDRHIANDFVKMWAHQSQLASIHKQIATVLRYEVSRLTARLCIAIGRGQVLCPADVRYTLLQTWLPPLVDDFGWMQRCCKGLDKNVVEDGLSQTILTLPLKEQQSILLSWFDRFSNNGDDCPNLQRAFEVWWRRTFVRPCTGD